MQKLLFVLVAFLSSYCTFGQSNNIALAVSPLLRDPPVYATPEFAWDHTFFVGKVSPVIGVGVSPFLIQNEISLRGGVSVPVFDEQSELLAQAGVGTEVLLLGEVGPFLKFDQRIMIRRQASVFGLAISFGIGIHVTEYLRSTQNFFVGVPLAIGLVF